MFNNMSKKGFVGICIAVSLAIIVVSVVFLKSSAIASKPTIDLSKFSKQRKFEMLVSSYKSYKEMESYEFQSLWIEQFGKATYKSGGNSSFGKYDCIHGPFHFWWKLGGQMKIKGIKSLERDYRSLVSLGKMSLRKKYKDIKYGDIIIFEPSMYKQKKDKSYPWHMALVNRKVNNRICFQDINPQTNMGIDRNFVFNKKFLGYKIRIYSMSWDYWVGNSLN